MLNARRREESSSRPIDDAAFDAHGHWRAMPALLARRPEFYPRSAVNSGTFSAPACRGSLAAWPMRFSSGKSMA